MIGSLEQNTEVILKNILLSQMLGAFKQVVQHCWKRKKKLLKACWKRVESNLNRFKLSFNIHTTFPLLSKMLNGVEAVWTLRSTFVQHPFNFCWNRLIKRAFRRTSLMPLKGRERVETRLSLQVRYHRIIACGTFKSVKPYFCFVFIFMPWIIAIDAIVTALICSRAVGSGHFW